MSNTIAYATVDVEEIFSSSIHGDIIGVLVTGGTVKVGDTLWSSLGGAYEVLSIRHYRDDLQEAHSGLRCGFGVEGLRDGIPMTPTVGTTLVKVSE